MANVKITDLTELSAADSAAVDVFPIVDIDADATKKITIASLRTTVAAANDFVTYTNITANVDIVQDNVAAGVVEATAIEARRVANIAGAVSTITTGNLDTGRAIISDGSGKVAASAVTSTEIGYLDGVTSAIQTQIDTKIATTDSASNDFITYTQLDANIDVVSANATAVDYTKGFFDCTTMSIGGDDVVLNNFSVTISNPAQRVGYSTVNSISHEPSAYLRGGMIEVTGSVSAKLDDNVTDTIDDFRDGTSVNISIGDGSAIDFDIPTAKYTGYTHTNTDSGVFIDLPFKATADGSNALITIIAT